MRLTLRTILAYLDDQLEPIQAREIGERISQSKEASALVTRIKEVIRRRRVGAPELAGPGSGPDPNLVSDYLENVLAPSQVLELERLCQASDIHLAEVAACHKILTMVLGQKIEVPEATRQRMHALGSRKAPSAPSPTESTLQPMTEGIGNAVAAQSLDDGLPDFLARRKQSRFWGIGLAVVVGIAWGILVITDQTLWSQPGPLSEEDLVARPIEPDQTNSVPGRVSGESEPSNRIDQVSASVSQSDGTRSQLAATDTVSSSVDGQSMPANGTNANPSINPPAPPDAPETSSETDLAKVTNSSEPPATTRPPSDSKTSTATARQDVAEKQGDPVPNVPPMIYVAGDGILLHLPSQKSVWKTIPLQTPIGIGDEVAAPEPFEGRLNLNESVELELHPGTRIKRLSSPDTTLALSFNRGQLVLIRPAAMANDVSIDLTVQGRQWRIELLEPETRCGVDLVLAEPDGPPGHMSELRPSGGLVVGKGRIRVSEIGQEATELTVADGYAPWPKDGDAMSPRADAAVPLWLLPEGKFVTPAARSLAKLYEREFVDDLSVVQSIGPVVKDRRASISDLAVQTMSLIDDYHELVTALHAENEEARTSAIRGLRLWLPQSPEHAPLLAEELALSFPEDQIAPVTRLLWGYGPDDARDKATSQSLVEQLGDPELVIRELAFYHVSNLTGRSHDYLPMAPLPERKAAINRWEEHLKRNDGTLLPAE
ncbi:MAG: hypothetical protein KDA80_02505 [Planctomycetaceae bacterium]|nr:hypothetical protein [Planctomycetaceae bacterium]